ncbi:MAG: DUF433 domain-containing protein [Bacteroidota bacterium]
MEYQHIITVEAGKRSGQACIRGMRITVGDILGYLAAGMTIDEILEDFPKLERTDIYASLAYAAAAQRRTSILKVAA